MSAYEEADECGACGAAILDIDVRCGSCGAALSSTGAQRLVGSVVLENYVITDILGQGGMSVVYRGKHKITDQEVALKVLPPELAAYKDVKGRFLEEGRALAQLDHPNIVHLYNFGDDGDCLVLAMQFVRGDTWERMILEQDSLPWRRSTELTRDVSNALDYAHGRGIIHRDMKPSNVLVRDLDGAATVMDFGIAKMQSSTKLTAEGQTMGTVRYMSPEQVRGVPVGVETDIYSLAMTAYESLVGDTPFTGETHFEIMTKHLNEAPVPPSERGVDLPPSLEAVLMRAMSKTPSDRQSSAVEFKEQLQAVLDGDEPQNINLDQGKTRSLGAKSAPVGHAAASRPASKLAATLPGLPEGKRGRGSGILLALGGLVLAAGVLTFALTRGSGPDRPKEKPTPTKKPHDDAFIMPGVNFLTDQTFEEDNLRILTTGEISADHLRMQVQEARAAYQVMAKEENWQDDAIPLALTILVVPQVIICNPTLYDEGKVLPSCRTRNAYYKPKERSLYVVDNGEGALDDLPFTIARIRCTHSKFMDLCSEAIRRRFLE
jgi:serine/threonine protein kinase